MRDADVIHLPALPFPVPTIAATTEGSPADIAQTINSVTHCVRAISYLGLPAMCVPAGFTSGPLPVAFQLVGRPFQEATLLRVADAYQRDTRWHRAMPPVACQ